MAGQPPDLSNVSILMILPPRLGIAAPWRMQQEDLHVRLQYLGGVASPCGPSLVR